MSFEENSESFIWRCDTCGRVADFPPGNFWGALAELKARNWRIARRDEGTEDVCWVHYCSRCRKKSVGAATNVAEFLNRTSRGSRP